MNKLIKIAAIGLATLALTACGNTETKTNEATSKIESAKNEVSSKVEQIKEDIKPEFKEKLEKVNQIAGLMPTSKAALIHLITNPKEKLDLTEEDAKYLVEYVKVDFKANAITQARNIDSTLHTSKQTIEKQLKETYLYTDDEISYALDKLDIDFKANALKAGQKLKDAGELPEEIKNHLISGFMNGYTEEEAQYAIDNLK